MPAKIKKVKSKKPAKKIPADKVKLDDEEFRPPRIPKVLLKEPKVKKKEVIEEEFDSEPVYTDDYDNTIYSTEY